MQLVIAEITRVLIMLAKGMGECKQADPMKLMNDVRRTKLRATAIVKASIGLDSCPI